MLRHSYFTGVWGGVADLTSGVLADVRLLDHSSPVPIHHQAARALEGAIEDGRPPRGSEQDLAEELRIGRPTMRAAPKQFVDEGLLTYRRGIGTVISTKPVRRAVALTSLYDDLMESGREPITSVSNTEVTLCPPEVTEPLGSGQMLPYCASTGCAWRASSRAPSCTTSSRLACWR